MSGVRKIQKVIKSKPTMEGAGVHLKRVFGFQHTPQLDPFLLLDDFHSNDPAEYLQGFPWHPHRGIETITYILHGEVEHGDSLGNQGVIHTGEVQWMTAGSGIIHQEMPKGDAQGRLWGFQLWANLPATHKMMAPRYREVKNTAIPELTLENGAMIRIISGEVNQVSGPVQDVVTNPQYLDIRLPANTPFHHPIAQGYTVFAYIIEGAGYFDERRDPYQFDLEGVNYFDLQRDCLMSSETLVLYDRDGELAVESNHDGLRFLLVSGKPIGEPVAWYGPIVMNTQQELQQAFDEYRRGTFLKHS